MRVPILPLLALSLLLAACGQSPAPMANPAPAPAIPPQPAPAAAPGVVDTTAQQPRLSATTVDGDPFELAAHRGRWVVVNF